MAAAGMDNPIILGLPDLCADLFALCVELRYEAPAADADGLRRQIGDLLRTLEQRAGAAGVARNELDDVRFALAATLDELVLTSQWPLREAWAARPLAIDLFDEPNAGEVFFDRLQAIARAGGRRAELLEVYLTCLHLGFRGQYADYDGVEKLKGLVAEHVRLALGEGAAGETLTPRPASGSAAGVGLRRWPAWAWVAAGLGAVVLLHLVLTWWSASTAASVRDLAQQVVHWGNK